jgi:outer membrane protein, adhesin transport system
MQGRHYKNERVVLPRCREIAWLVSSIFTLAPVVFAQAVHAQGIAGMRSHTSVTEWASQPKAAGPASTTAVARDEAALAAQVRADERKRLAEIDTAMGQARLAAQAKRDEDARLQRQAQIDKQADLLQQAQAREAARIMREAADAQARQQAAMQAQEAKRREQAEQEAAQARMAAEQHRAEQARQAEAARIAQARAENERRSTVLRQAEAAQAASEQARAVAAKRAQEAAQEEANRKALNERMAAEQRRIAEERQAVATRVALAKADEERRHAEQRRADEARAVEAKRVAEAARAAEQQRERESARIAAAVQAEAMAEAARENRPDKPVPNSAQPSVSYAPPLAARARGDTSSAVHTEGAAPLVFVPVDASIPQANRSSDVATAPVAPSAAPVGTGSKRLEPPVSTMPAASATPAGGLWLGPSPQRPAPLPGSLASDALQAVLPSKKFGTAREATDASDGAASSRSTPSKASPSVPLKGAPGQFAQWLETQPDTFGGGPSLSPEQLRDIFWQAARTAAERSPEVRSAYADYQAATADVAEAKGQRWPQVDVGSQSPSASFGPGGGNGGNGSNPLSVNVTTNVFDWGRTSNTIGSREQLSNAANLKYEAVMENSAYEVSTALLEIGKQRNIVELSQQFVDRMATLVRMLGEIVQVDRGRGSELTQAKTRLLQAEAARDTAEAKIRDAELTLRKLVGDKPVPIPRTREWAIEPGNLPKLLSQAATHPSLRQAEAEANAASLNAKAVKAAGRPQVNWVVSAGLNKDALGRRQPWQTMLTLNWGAFRGGSANAATEAAMQRATASQQRSEQQRRDLEYAVRTADQDAHTMLQRADLYQGLSAETDRVRKAFFEQWYHLGRRTLLDVLTAENDHYGNRVAEVSNRFDGYLAVFKEHYAAGGLAPWLKGEKASDAESVESTVVAR